MPQFDRSLIEYKIPDKKPDIDLQTPHNGLDFEIKGRPLSAWLITTIKDKNERIVRGMEWYKKYNHQIPDFMLELLAERTFGDNSKLTHRQLKCLQKRILKRVNNTKKKKKRRGKPRPLNKIVRRTGLIIYFD